MILPAVPKATDYVLQAHEISRAAYMLSVPERRLLYVAMSQVDIKGEELPVVEMKTGDVVRALGLPRSKFRYEEIRAACQNLRGQVLNMDKPGGGWIVYGWVDYAEWDAAKDTLSIKLCDTLKPFVLDLKGRFSVLALADIAKLQGKYSLRIWELVLANMGHAGKGGNQPDEWFVQLHFSTLRAMFKIDPKEYKATNDLRKRVIDQPVREINEADLGIRIECEYESMRHGRTLLGVFLRCRKVARDEPRPVFPATQSESEEAELKTRHPEKFEEILASVRAEPPLPGIALDPEIEALRRLEAWEKSTLPKRRGRPPKARTSPTA